jgi:hypothetical protein
MLEELKGIENFHQAALLVLYVLIFPTNCAKRSIPNACVALFFKLSHYAAAIEAVGDVLTAVKIALLF